MRRTTAMYTFQAFSGSLIMLAFSSVSSSSGRSEHSCSDRSIALSISGLERSVSSGSR